MTSFLTLRAFRVLTPQKKRWKTSASTTCAPRMARLALFGAATASLSLGCASIVSAQKTERALATHYKKWRDNPKVCCSKVPGVSTDTRHESGTAVVAHIWANRGFWLAVGTLQPTNYPMWLAYTIHGVRVLPSMHL